MRSVWLAGMIVSLAACSQPPAGSDEADASSATAEPSAPDVVVPFADVAFADEAPGQPQQLGKLWGERAEGPAGTYLRTPGGFEAPLHSHTADYRAVVIQGVWSHWVPAAGDTSGEPLPVGSYWTQRADQPHKDACLYDEPCVILLINRDPYVTELTQPAPQS